MYALTALFLAQGECEAFISGEATSLLLSSWGHASRRRQWLITCSLNRGNAQRLHDFVAHTYTQLLDIFGNLRHTIISTYRLWPCYPFPNAVFSAALKFNLIWLSSRAHTGLGRIHRPKPPFFPFLAITVCLACRLSYLFPCRRKTPTGCVVCAS